MDHAPWTTFVEPVHGLPLWTRYKDLGPCFYTSQHIIMLLQLPLFVSLLAPIARLILIFRKLALLLVY